MVCYAKSKTRSSSAEHLQPTESALRNHNPRLALLSITLQGRRVSFELFLRKLCITACKGCDTELGHIHHSEIRRLISRNAFDIAPR